jgi:dihydrofolate reductase
MRKLVVSLIVSLDGYMEGPGGNVMALPMDDFFDAANLDRQRAAGTLLAGATTYRMFRSYWPAIADDPTISPTVAANPALAGVHAEIGRRNNELTKVVVSDSLTPAETAPWSSTTTIVRRVDARERIAELKRHDGADLLVFGSRTLVADLLAAGLVDELYLMVGATVLGGGGSAFGDAGPLTLRLLDVQTRRDSDNVLLHYAVAHEQG